VLHKCGRVFLGVVGAEELWEVASGCFDLFEDFENMRGYFRTLL